MTPNEPRAISLLAEALWANGQVPDAEYNLRRLVSIDSANASAYLLLGDIQQLQRRSDSAAAFWSKGLTDPKPGPIAIDLLIRLGNRERHRSPDSSRAHLARARNYADRLLLSSRAQSMTMIRYGEALMATDSTELALSYFRFAAYVADSPQELGRIYLGIGQCQDLARRRQEAIKAYEYVFKIPATYYDSETAKYYVNHVYKR
jgi:tetratricopeptide (TPR) repeat protein